MEKTEKTETPDAELKPNALVKQLKIILGNQAGEWVKDEDFNPTPDEIIELEDNIEKDDDNQPEDLYAAFVKRATKIPRLSEETERSLGRKIRDHNDEGAAKKLVVHNLRLAIKIAHQYQRNWTSLMDLVQEASAGLAIAAKKWDPDKGTRYGTYASYWIRAQLTKFLMTNSRLIHTGNTRAGRKLYYALPQIQRKLLASGQAANVENIAKEAGEDPEEVALVLSRLQGSESSLSTPIDDSGATVLQDVLSGGDDNPENLTARFQISQLVDTLVQQFEQSIDNERELIVWRENLISNEPVSLVDLGQKFGVSKQRMGQIATKLKRSFRRHIIDVLGPHTQLSWLFSDD